MAGLEFSWRDLILVGGGLFLIVKATLEMHDRLEARPHAAAGSQVYAAFWAVIAQIVVLDAVFSLDSVITAIGMVDELPVMMAAVVIAVLVMLVASKPLTRFVNQHPTLVILCLGFLLMIGLVLVADGFGVHVPKGYLYAAIGFSVLIELFNQLASRNRRKLEAQGPQRQRIADAVLRLIGGVPMAMPGGTAAAPPEVEVAAPAAGAAATAFGASEKRMVMGVLALANRPVRTIMTPRPDVTWIDADESREAILAAVRDSPHRQFIVGRGSIDEVAGIARKEDIYALWLDDGGAPFDVAAAARPATALHEGASVLDALNLFKGQPIEMAPVVDEYGAVQGIVTLTDFLEAIAGDLAPDVADEPEASGLDDGSWQIDGAMSVHDAREQIGLGDVPDGDFTTMAGLALKLFNGVPKVGDRVEWDGWRFEVAAMDGWRIEQLRARSAERPAA